MAKIILAEDDPVSSHLITKVVEKMGHTVFRCSNGRRAFEALMDNPDVAMLITDINMPEMTGEELATVLLGEGGYSSVPIVVCSGAIHSAGAMALMKQGAATCIPKPVQPEALTAAVAEYIQQ